MNTPRRDFDRVAGAARRDAPAVPRRLLKRRDRHGGRPE
jgi:hypothetical protein